MLLRRQTCLELHALRSEYPPTNSAHTFSLILSDSLLARSLRHYRRRQCLRRLVSTPFSDSRRRVRDLHQQPFLRAGVSRGGGRVVHGRVRLTEGHGAVVGEGTEATFIIIVTPSAQHPLTHNALRNQASQPNPSEGGGGGEGRVEHTNHQHNSSPPATSPG